MDEPAEKFLPKDVRWTSRRDGDRGIKGDRSGNRRISEYLAVMDFHSQETTGRG